MPSEPDYIREFFELFERPRILPFIMGFAGIDPCEKHQGGGGGDFPEAPTDGKIYGRKDAAWAEVQTGGASTHNALDGLQGGKAGGGGEYFHLTEAEYRRLPIRPTVISPVNGGTGVNQVPQIVGSPYSSPWDVPMRARHCQIAADAGFGNIVWEEESFSASVVWQVLLKPDQTPYVSPNTRYYVRIRYQDKHGRWSEWSGASAFTTMAAFPESVILTPVMLMPTEGGELPPVNPILAMSSPKVLAGAENFDAADWQISNDHSFASTLYSASESAGVTVHMTEGVNLATALGVQFYARGRQRTSSGEWSPWAVPASFTVRPDFDDPIFGMRRIFSKTWGQALIYNIDQDGKQVSVPHEYWDRHPLLAFPHQTVVVGQNSSGDDVSSEMAFLPPCWVRLHVYEDEDGDLVIDQWFSATDQTGDGWFLHPAFRRSPDGVLIGHNHGRYESINTGYVFISSEQNPHAVSTYEARYMAHMKTLDARWHNETVYERRLLVDLFVAEKGRMDLSEEMTHNLPWRGFLNLFGNLTNCFMDGVQFVKEGDAFTGVRLTVPEMNGSYVTVPISGFTLGATAAPLGVARGMADVLGFDVAMLGLYNQAGEGSGEPWGVPEGYVVDDPDYVALFGTSQHVKYTGAYGVLPSKTTSNKFMRVAKWL